MSLRVIKQGTQRSLDIRPFFFLENREEGVPEQLFWTEASFEDEFPSGKKQIEEPPAPAVDVEGLRKEAFDDGFSQGQASERAIQEKRIEELTRRYAESLDEIGSLKSVLRAQAEREVVKLAVAVARKIVDREINIDPEITQTLVHVALARVSEKSAAVIRLNPVDCDFLANQPGEQAQAEGREVSFVSDNSISRGGCVIQTDCGNIDARVEEKFREVENAFFENGT